MVDLDGNLSMDYPDDICSRCKLNYSGAMNSMDSNMLTQDICDLWWIPDLCY